MQQYKIKNSGWMCAATSFFVSSTLHAAVPPVNITLSTGSNVISVGPGQTATVEYLIQDVIGRPPARTWLWNAPIPAYMSRTASLHQPDCSVYNQNPASPNSFVLPPNGSCYFAMEVNGTILASQGASTTTYKPLFSNSGAIAYGPCSPLQLTPAIAGILLSGGSYLDSFGTQRPLLISSRDKGNTWVYPNAIPSVPPATTFFRQGLINGTSCTGTTCIAAGRGEDDAFHSMPLLAVSQDSALNWNYIVALSSPVFTPGNTNPYVKNGLFTSASCSGTVCIAGGQYESAFGIGRPLLAVSQNKAFTWIFPDSITEPVFVPDNTLDPYAHGGIFNAVSCSSPLCIAAGNYQDDNLIIRPLLAYSQNGGGTWIYPDSIPQVSFTPVNVNPYAGQGDFFGASCSGSTCVTAGLYLDINNVTRPLIAYTNDAGNTWTYPTPVTAPPVIPAFISGFFQDVSCSATTCVAAGNYSSNGFTSNPLLAVSQDGGANWTFPANIPVPVFTPVDSNPFSLNGFFNNTSCSGNLCIAVGSYADTNLVARPLLALSQDAGSTWSYPEVITAPVFVPSTTNPFTANGSFNAASCDGSTCIASGTYISGGEQRPLIVITTDGGVTWTYSDSVTSPVFTPGNTYPFDGSGTFNAATASTSFLPKWLQIILEKIR